MVNTPPLEEFRRTASSSAQAAYALGSSNAWGGRAGGFRSGQVLVQRPQWTHASRLTAGVKKPEGLQFMEIASLGQMLAQAEQPVHRVESSGGASVFIMAGRNQFLQGAEKHVPFIPVEVEKPDGSHGQEAVAEGEGQEGEPVVQR